MKKFSHLWHYLAESLLEWEKFRIKLVEKIKKNILCSFFFSKLCPLWDNVEKYGGARQSTHDNKIGFMRFTCCVRLHARTNTPTPTRSRTHPHARTHSRTRVQKYVILITFPRINGFVNAPQYYVIRTLPLSSLSVSLLLTRTSTFLTSKQGRCVLHRLYRNWSGYGDVYASPKCPCAPH